jgi:hypothetical protein
MTRTMHADPETAEARHEAEHGPIMRYNYGALDPASTWNGEAASFADALEQLLGGIGDAHDIATSSIDEGPRYRAVSNAWSVFADYVKAVAAITEDIDLTGPDGMTYFVEKIDR